VFFVIEELDLAALLICILFPQSQQRFKYRFTWAYNNQARVHVHAMPAPIKFLYNKCIYWIMLVALCPKLQKDCFLDQPGGVSRSSYNAGALIVMRDKCNNIIM
jgi:hypothetical protein